jgi:hypothetical protein
MADETPIHGIDFSGAEDACKRIWIASGTASKEGLRIKECRPVSNWLRSLTSLESCLAALREFIKEEDDAVIGIDFPFSLPSDLVHESDWRSFVLEFGTRFRDADRFREGCFDNAGNGEPKRITDRLAKTPFSLCNLRLYRQTFYGICDVLAPLVREDAARVLPLQEQEDGKPTLIEICPASTLKGLNLYGKNGKYKGKDKSQEMAREVIMRHLENNCSLEISSNCLRTSIIENVGDALDSVIAAYAAFRAYHNGFRTDSDCQHYHLEGYVYGVAELTGEKGHTSGN